MSLFAKRYVGMPVDDAEFPDLGALSTGPFNRRAD